jgi:hypothetical protein
MDNNKKQLYIKRVTEGSATHKQNIIRYDKLYSLPYNARVKILHKNQVFLIVFNKIKEHKAA